MTLIGLIKGNECAIWLDGDGGKAAALHNPGLTGFGIGLDIPNGVLDSFGRFCASKLLGLLRRIIGLGCGIRSCINVEEEQDVAICSITGEAILVVEVEKDSCSSTQWFCEETNNNQTKQVNYE